MSQNKVEVLSDKLSMCKIDVIEDGKIMKFFDENEIKIVKTNKREYKICNVYDDYAESSKRKRV